MDARCSIDFTNRRSITSGPLGGDKGEKFLSETERDADLERDAGKENPDR